MASPAGRRLANPATGTFRLTVPDGRILLRARNYCKLCCSPLVFLHIPPTFHWFVSLRALHNDFVNLKILCIEGLMSGNDSTIPTPRKAAPSNLPPGMVMGPDGKPCKICTAFRNWGPPKSNAKSDPDRPAKTWPAPESNTAPSQKGALAAFAGLTGINVASRSTSGSVTSTTNAASETTLSSRGDGPPPDCPPDVEQLGRATWTFLHTTAAYYPEKPTPTQRANMLMLLGSLSILYPCGWCAKDFGESMEKTKPDVSGRTGLSRWLCERHNEVNDKLGKKKFDCAKVDERWKDGPSDGSCD